MKHHSYSNEIEKAHVVLVSLYRVVNSKGGAEKVLCDMANELLIRGYDVTVLFYQDKQGKLGFYLNEKIRLINAYTSSGFFLKNNFWKKVRCWSFNKEVRRKNRRAFRFTSKAKSIQLALRALPAPNVFISFCPESTYILRNLLKLKTPLVTMYHVKPDIFSNDENFNRLYKDAVSKSDVIQVLMPEYVAIAKKLHPETRIVIIPNIAPQYDESANLAKKKIVNVARFDLQKDPELLVRAFALIKDQFPDWICEWWGETSVNPDLTKKIEKLIESKGLKDRFLLKGVTNDVPAKLADASIFAFSSAFEGFSIALAEAFAMGLPAVGRKDCPAVNTLIRDGKSGFLTEPTPEAFAEGLVRLMESEALRRKFGTQGKEDMRAYSADRVWDAWEKLILDLIRK